jgi:hypothetical protein
MAPSYLFNPFFPTHPLKATLTYKTGFSKNAPVIFFIPVRFLSYKVDDNGEEYIWNKA